jgi:NADPH:quinone reductase-like Zn-dependent oxidoreductase
MTDVVTRTSRAVCQQVWGGEETLTLDEVEVPVPLPTEVLVRVKAAGVNPIDVYTREGIAYVDALSLPFIQGWDVAGVVEAVGYGTTRFGPPGTWSSRMPSASPRPHRWSTPATSGSMSTGVVNAG